MERVRLLGAAGGAVFAVATVVAFAVAPGPSSAGGVDVVDYYTAHGDAAIWQAVIAGFGLLCFVWFAGVFAGVSPVGPVVLVSASVVAALYLVTLGAWESLGETYRNTDLADITSSTYGDAHVLYDVGVGAAHMALFMDAAFVGATAAALLTAPVPWRRLGLVGIGLTVVLAIDAPLQIRGTSDWTDAVGVVAFLALLAWVFTLSVVLVASLRRAPVAVPPAATPA
jgi:hypothetical protein